MVIEIVVVDGKIALRINTAKHLAIPFQIVWRVAI
jgi:hypothetical protein